MLANASVTKSRNICLKKLMCIFGGWQKEMGEFGRYVYNYIDFVCFTVEWIVMRLLNVPSRECGQNSEDGFGLLWKKPHLIGPGLLDSKFNFF